MRGDDYLDYIDRLATARRRLRAEETRPFRLTSEVQPAGDQPAAIAALADGLTAGRRDQVLMGVTGSGKTFTMANVIARLGRPAIVLAPNKTLAAQLYGELRGLFPGNAVEYFVSYYDYYQPEAYVPRSDTYVEKEASVNEQIDRMRHSATRALFERRDVVIVASVSCIYGMGSPETYAEMVFALARGETCAREEVIRRLDDLQYRRNDGNFARGTFRARGDVLEIFPAHLSDRAWRLSFFGDEVERMTEFDPLTGERHGELDDVKVYANSHYIVPRPTLGQAMEQIGADLEREAAAFDAAGKLLESQRLRQRVSFDLEMMEATGSCAGIENYSRYLSGRNPGEPPPTLFEYTPEDAVLFVDESHITVPQLGGMYKGDFARKTTLAAHGFRLAACVDNRPLKFAEWEAMRPQTVYVSATPGDWETARAPAATEQVVRPTGLLDPECEVFPTEGQVDEILRAAGEAARAGRRTLITTLTKRMAENLSEYLGEAGLRVRYLHSDIETLERIAIIRDLRLGEFDVLVGINLLREGLDIPECGLVCILDADKEGFLRSARSLIQTIGRAARNVDGRVMLFADAETAAMRAALGETRRRRSRQEAYNLEHGIIPESVRKGVADVLGGLTDVGSSAVDFGGVEGGVSLRSYLEELGERMRSAAEVLEFEEAARLRDEIRRLEEEELGL
ncbi:MAG: excinuclease ABC subunit UvrB [Alphaproteobacteria bacterium]|nr:excinuclease ABC subunit UvrB [Alphaproteobacteria bacterium]MDA7983571.1 excinuclease ABC subunit UvrB [Alphaproteobacteria bacterium]MDA7989115.1 excinuclease ABC subunit UvrB [Alphaproteobacteria bacterium]MDA8009301.1 excinuclease ABC subunit UvrB [Alphaproteobacteria bacterium]